MKYKNNPNLAGWINWQWIVITHHHNIFHGHYILILMDWKLGWKWKMLKKNLIVPWFLKLNTSPGQWHSKILVPAEMSRLSIGRFSDSTNMKRGCPDIAVGTTELLYVIIRVPWEMFCSAEVQGDDDTVSYQRKYRVWYKLLLQLKRVDALVVL